MKRIVASLLLAVRDVFAWVHPANEVAIFCYHSISDAAVPTAIRAHEFERQLAYLRRCGYTFISLDQLLDWREGKGALPRKAIALTFDDGYADFETVALPLLERAGAPVALFVMGDAVASRGALGTTIPLLLSEAFGRVRNHPLVTVGYHSMTHANLSKLAPPVTNRAGDRVSAKLMQEMKPTFQTKYFAYPGGNYSSDAMRLARELGYRAAFSIKRHLIVEENDTFLLPRSVITRDMSLRTVRFHATRALEWYRALAPTAKLFSGLGSFAARGVVSS